MILKITGGSIVLFFVALWKIFVTDYFALKRDELLSNQFAKSIFMATDYQIYSVLGSVITFDVVVIIGLFIMIYIFRHDIEEVIS